MSDLARRLVAAEEMFEAARQLVDRCEPYDVAQTTSARELGSLVARLQTARERAERRS